MVAQSPSLSSHYNDPLRNFKFQVTFTPMGVGDAIVMGFMTVQGLSVAIQPIIYNQGGMNAVTQKMPAQADFGNITLSTGVVCRANPLDLEMLTTVFAFVQGTAPPTSKFVPSTSDFRYTVDIEVLQHPVTTAEAPTGAWFRVFDAWPTTFAWADLDAGANQPFISEIVLVNGGFDVLYAHSPTTSVGP